MKVLGSSLFSYFCAHGLSVASATADFQKEEDHMVTSSYDARRTQDRFVPGEGEQYCDDSPDALSFVPAARSCTNVGGQNRCWFTYTPPSLGGQQPGTDPLVLDLHRFGGCAQLCLFYTGWRGRAYAEDF